MDNNAHVEVQCKTCNKAFSILRCYFNKPRKSGFACSRECANKNRFKRGQNLKTVICKVCSKPFSVFPSSIVMCCSSKCSKIKRSISLRAFCGDRASNWNGGSVIKERGSIDVYIGRKKYRQRSRYNIENFIGRSLKKTEIVHHIDLNKQNDDISNLFIFRSLAAHSRWHRFIERQGIDPTVLKSNVHLVKEYA